MLRSITTTSTTTTTSTAVMSGSTKSIKSFFSVDGSSKKRKVENISNSEEVSIPTEDTTISPSPSLKNAKHSHENNNESKIPQSNEVYEIASSVNAVECENDNLPSTGWPPLDTMESSWRRRLAPEFHKPYFQRLMQFLTNEARQHTIFPPSNQLFTALNLCPFDTVKVVVIGQDPYHGPGQAHGLAFSVQKGVQLPPSLRNMITEAQNDPAVRIPAPKHGNLECWACQGVLMLNTVLTVRKAEANSHQKKGYEASII